MTLKEKFRDKILSFLNDNMKEQNAINCEKIADEFAIGFAEWIENYTYHKKYNVWIKNDSLTVGKTTTKKLLEIYKKEKGL